eukprot:6482786-Amphidinium_carterae.1
MSKIRLVLTQAVKEHAQLQELWGGTIRGSWCYMLVAEKVNCTTRTPWQGHLLAEMAKQGQNDTIAASWLTDDGPLELLNGREQTCEFARPRKGGCGHRFCAFLQELIQVSL